MDARLHPSRIAALLAAAMTVAAMPTGCRSQRPESSAPAAETTDFNRLRAERDARLSTEAVTRTLEIQAENRAKRVAEIRHEAEAADRDRFESLIRTARTMPESERARLGLPALPDYLAARRLPRTERRSAAHALWRNWLAGLNAEQTAALTAAADRIEAVAHAQPIHPFGELPLPDPSAGYDWEETADNLELGAATVERLRADGLALETGGWKQSFEVYTGASLPVFITSDSLLNGFHVLLEDSWRELELRRIPALRRTLEQCATAARQTAKRSGRGYAAAERHALRVLGPALRLLGAETAITDPRLRGEIERQVGLIRAADTAALPAWLGPSTEELPALDYRRCRPAGFYAEGRFLPDYFRAVRWLQMVPFRADRNDELLALRLLRAALDDAGNSDTAKFLAANQRRFGGGDDPTLLEFREATAGNATAEIGKPDAELASLRSALDRHGDRLRDGRSMIRDHARGPIDPTKTPPPLQFRLLPSALLPDALHLQQLAQRGAAPQGLRVAAFLGSDFAHAQLRETEAAPPVTPASAPANANDPASRHSLYAEYLDVLRTLARPAVPEAPPLFSSPAWSRKTCQTLLGSWAQARHTFTLQAKESVYAVGMVEKPAGFIEPVPDFFRQLAELCFTIRKSLHEEGAFAPSTVERADYYIRLIELVRRLRPFDFDRTELERACDREFDGGERSSAGLPEFLELLVIARECGVDLDTIRAEQTEPLRARLIAELQERAKKGTFVEAALTTHSPPKLVERWASLEQLARELAAMSRQQLRREPWTREQANFIRGYGDLLAETMGYFGDSGHFPRDDAPRCAAVFHDTSNDRQLIVGIGRPMTLYLRYPWNGGDILCIGSVLGYRESWEPAQLTDAAWRAKLDSPAAPPVPEWLAPIVPE